MRWRAKTVATGCSSGFPQSLLRFYLSLRAVGRDAPWLSSLWSLLARAARDRMFTLASSIETTALRTSMTDLGLTEQVSQNCVTARLSGLAFGWIRTSLRFDSRVLIGRRASANRLSKSVKLSRSTMEHSVRTAPRVYSRLFSKLRLLRSSRSSPHCLGSSSICSDTFAVHCACLLERSHR